MNKKFICYFEDELALKGDRLSSFNKLICDWFKSNHKTISFRKVSNEKKNSIQLGRFQS